MKKQNSSKVKQSTAASHFRSWKTGKSWLYAATTVVALAGGVIASTLVAPTATGIVAHADAVSDATSYASTASSSASLAVSASAKASSVTSSYTNTGSTGTSVSTASQLAETATLQASGDASIAKDAVSATSSFQAMGSQEAIGIASEASLAAYDAAAQASQANLMANAAMSLATLSSATTGSYGSLASSYAITASTAYLTASSAYLVAQSVWTSVANSDNTVPAYYSTYQAAQLGQTAELAASGDALFASQQAAYATQNDVNGYTSLAQDAMLQASLYAQDAAFQTSLAVYYASAALLLASTSSESSSSSSSSSSASSDSSSSSDASSMPSFAVSITANVSGFATASGLTVSESGMTSFKDSMGNTISLDLNTGIYTVVFANGQNGGTAKGSIELLHNSNNGISQDGNMIVFDLYLDSVTVSGDVSTNGAVPELIDTSNIPSTATSGMGNLSFMFTDAKTGHLIKVTGMVSLTNPDNAGFWKVANVSASYKDTVTGAMGALTWVPTATDSPDHFVAMSSNKAGNRNTMSVKPTYSTKALPATGDEANNAAIMAGYGLLAAAALAGLSVKVKPAKRKN